MPPLHLYPNRILLCANHHIEIDQDPAKWPIEKLHQIKADHELWVETQLTEVTLDHATKYYSDLVNKATDSLMLPYWGWFSDHAFRLLLSEKFADGANYFWMKVQKAIWPGKYPELEKAIENLAQRVGVFVTHFLDKAKLRESSKKPDQGFFVEDKGWAARYGEDYDSYSQKSQRWQKESSALLFNLAVALNEYADAVRKYLNPHYLVFQGKFIIEDTMGLTNEMRPVIFTPVQYVDVKIKKRKKKRN